MPIYEFQCAACGHRFDRLQKMADPDPAECPECAQPQVSRRLTAPSFRLAGAGWYETDFKRDGDKKRNLAGAEEAPKSDAASSKTGGDSKGEAPAVAAAKSEPAPVPKATPTSDSGS